MVKVEVAVANPIIEPLKYIKISFEGGMNFTFEATKLADNQYPLLVNGRNRLGTIDPIKLPQLMMSGLPAGVVIQGIYGADRFLLCFASGLAYYMDLSVASPIFVPVVGFSMPLNPPNYSTYAPIYAVAVNAASITYKRNLTDPTDNTKISLTSAISGSEIGVVCQDGYNQPWLIYSNGTARVIQNYGQWIMDDTSPGNQEYVPIGKYMLWKDPILYVVAKDGNQRYTQILHSVSGRPLDFVVNITPTGDKGGDAYSVAHRASFDEITGINDLNTVDGSFMVATLKATYVVTPNYNNTIFGEPTYSNYTLFSTGSLNPFSMADINGDTAIIDQTGIKSFNAMKQLKIESNSEPFSSPIFNLFISPTTNRSITQTVTAATNYDNYALFAMDTVYGPAIVIYDLLLKCFVGIDMYPGLSHIVQFAETKLFGKRHMFFRTEDDEVYEMFGSTDNAICRIYLGEYCAQDAKVEQKPESLDLVFTNISDGGDFQATVFVDRRQDSVHYNHVDFVPIAGSITHPIPFPQNTDDNVRMLSYPFPSSKTGWKVGFLLEWDCQASLSHVTAVSRSVTLAVDFHQQANIAKNYVPQL